jgi:aldehyde dehydrogenase (NAD+)
MLSKTLQRQFGSFTHGSAPHHTKLFINGKWEKSTTGEILTPLNPYTEKVIGEFQCGGVEDVNRAVEAARYQFDSGVWSKTGPRERRAILLKMADLIEENQEELISMESTNNGMAWPVAKFANIGFAVNVYRYYAGLTLKNNGHMNPIDGPFMSYSEDVPVGVCGAIIPFNFPFLMAALKVGPALASGCTIIIKPEEKTPMTALKLAEIC